MPTAIHGQCQLAGPWPGQTLSIKPSPPPARVTLGLVALPGSTDTRAYAANQFPASPDHPVRLPSRGSGDRGDMSRDTGRAATSANADDLHHCHLFHTEEVTASPSALNRLADRCLDGVEPLLCLPVLSSAVLLAVRPALGLRGGGRPAVTGPAAGC